MNCLWKGYDPQNAKYERDFPMAFPWNRPKKEDEPRYIWGGDGYFYDPSARNTGRALLSFTGDLMCEPAQCRVHRYGDAYFFHPAFSFVRDIFKSSDFVIGNLETTISDNTPYAGEYHRINYRYHCNGPEAYLDALRYAGYDALVTANNHDCDSGVVGIKDTADALSRHGFAYTGTCFDDNRAMLVNVNGIRIGILSYVTTCYGMEDNLTDEGVSKYLNKFDEKTAREDVAWARARGAEFIVAYIHWGIDYEEEPNDSQKAYLTSLGESGVDYIVGSHTHCLQRFDRYERSDGKIIPLTFSMGNFVTNEKKELCKHTGVLQLTLTRRDCEIKVEENFIPCYVFDEYKTARYCVVPTLPRFSGVDCEKLREAKEYVHSRIGEGIREPKTCTASLLEICDAMGLDAPCNAEYTPVSRLCTRSGITKPNALYFARGDEERQEQLLVIKNLVCAVVAPEPWEGVETIICDDVASAYKKACALLKSRRQVPCIAVTGKRGKTLTRQLLCYALSSRYSVITHKDKYHADTGVWQDGLEYNDFCVFEINNDEPMCGLLETIAPEYVICTDDFEKTSDIIDLPFEWQKKCTQGVLDFCKKFDIIDTALEGFVYESANTGIAECSGVTVVYDLACLDAREVIDRASKISGRKLVMGFDLPENIDADYVWDAGKMSLRERENAIMDVLCEGDVIVLCGARGTDIDVTLRRIFGISDGFILGGR